MLETSIESSPDRSNSFSILVLGVSAFCTLSHQEKAPPFRPPRTRMMTSSGPSRFSSLLRPPFRLEERIRIIASIPWLGIVTSPEDVPTLIRCDMGDDARNALLPVAVAGVAADIPMQLAYHQKTQKCLLFSLLSHTLLYVLLNFVVPATPLAAAFFLDLVLLVIAGVGINNRIPWLLLPNLIVKFLLFLTAVGVTCLCIGGLNASPKAAIERAQFRKAHTPELLTALLEQHPSIPLWSVVVVTLLAIETKLFFTAWKHVEIKRAEDNQEKNPPPYSVCMSSSKSVNSLPTYADAIKKAQARAPPPPKLHESAV
ncbi:unnamed protein product [Caenorhabditis auriculariae]|uniref:Uncharacterized protein n=1 Tax=Caenorhabditis auriculariae TaxID=2777116 RepID=A0A8S1GZX8_9PELO|nr:unnamed protein product [Caenorhabditis auriculariae]